MIQKVVEQDDLREMSSKRGPGRLLKIYDADREHSQRQMIDRLRGLVKKYYLTQNEFAHAVKLDNAVISKLLGGRLELSDERTIKICRLTGFSANYIKSGLGPEQSDKPLSVFVEEGHQGKALEAYLKQRGISWTSLRDLMGKKSLAGVTQYRERQQFQQKTRRQIMAALEELNSTEDEIFGTNEPLAVSSQEVDVKSDITSDEPLKSSISSSFSEDNAYLKTYNGASLPTNLQTVEEFEQWEPQHAHEGSYEFVRGRIIDRGGVEQRSLYLHVFLSRLFYNTSAFQHGDMLATRLDSYVSGTCLRVPDLSYYNASQLDAMRRKEKQATRFAIEILSDSESHQDVLDKIQDYFDAGAEIVWYIIPESKKIYVYTSPDESKAFKGAEIISAAPVLPDFQFVVANLFA